MANTRGDISVLKPRILELPVFTWKQESDGFLSPGGTVIEKNSQRSKRIPRSCVPIMIGKSK